MADTRPTNERRTPEAPQDSARFLRVRAELIIRENEYAPSATSDRIEAEFSRIQKFGDDDLDTLSAVIGAEDGTDVARKLYRFVLASLDPGAVLGRAMKQQDPGDFEVFCLRLSAYGEFMSLVEEGLSPRQAADLVMIRQRQRVQEKMRPRFDAPRDEGVWMRVDADVFRATNEIDLGALRAEIDRLLDHLDVNPARIRVSFVPHEASEE